MDGGLGRDDPVRRRRLPSRAGGLLPRLSPLNGGDPPAGLREHAWTGRHNFLDLPARHSAWDTAGVVILPIPYEATTSWGTGTREGPAAIIEASRYIEWYDEELDTEPYEQGVYTLPSIDLGTEGPRVAVSRLRALYDDLLDAAGERFVIGLGGEHSISSAPATAWADRLDGDVTILQFDAHTDLRDRHHGSRWNHACVMRRVLERTSNLVSVGIRALTREERDIIREHGLEVVFAHEMRRPGWVECALGALGTNVYITFDVDFFDPSLMPATGTPEPGGGGWWDALDLLSRVFRERNVVGADIVELAPRRGEEASAFTAAKLAYKMIGFRAASRSAQPASRSSGQVPALRRRSIPSSSSATSCRRSSRA